MKTNTLYEWRIPCSRCSEFFYFNMKQTSYPKCSAEVAKHGVVGLNKIGKWFEIGKVDGLSFKFPTPILAAIIFIALLSGCEPCMAAQIDEQKLADAIRIEEGNNPHYFYGVHHKGTTPLTEPESRRRCIETIRHAERDFSGSGNFITFLSLRYCPVNHQSWAYNVRKLYDK